MRIFSIITAILVAGALYMLVFERDRVMEFAGGGGAEERAVETAETASEPEAAPAEDNAERIVHVVALKSTAQQIDSAVLVRGETEAAREVDVRAETTGLVNSEPLRKGARVEADQLLCSIDPGTRLTALADAKAKLPEARARLPEAEGRLAEAQARVAEAEINDNAARRLSEDGFASEVRVATTVAAVQSALAGVETAKAAVESARSGIQSTEAAIEAAEQEVEKLEIRAPFAGLLETDTAELGSLMQAGGLCATVIQLNPMKLVGYVPETEVSEVTVGSRALGRTTAGQQVVGAVNFLSRSSDPETRTFRVEITVPNDDRGLRDGQTVEILIEAEGELAHLIPASAMTLNNEGTLGVRTASDGMAGFTPVSILRDTPEGIWVAGLEAEAEIIIVGQEYVTEGVKIDVTYQEAKG